MPELRVDVEAETAAVLDGYCSANGKCRTVVVNEVLSKWAKKRVHEARVIVRVAGDKPEVAESERRK